MDKFFEEEISKIYPLVISKEDDNDWCYTGHKIY